MKIGILHGWLLDGSGSNNYVRSLSKALARRGHEVHIICQEPHPERFGPWKAAYRYREDLSAKTVAEEMSAEDLYLHIPYIDPSLMPVFVADADYEGFKEVRAFHELANDPRLGRYLAQFTAGAAAICRKQGIELIHANHCFPMPEVARRIKETLGTRYIVFPHGSTIEYTLKKSKKIASEAKIGIDAADALVVGNSSLSRRLFRLYPDRAPTWKRKQKIVSVGVDPDIFEPLPFSSRGQAARRLGDSEFFAGGRTAGMTRALLDASHGDEGGLRAAVLKSRDAYVHKAPDADLAEKLDRIDWTSEKIIIYTGKVLIGKGIHDFLTALPAILETRPGTTLFVVGEGPYREALELILHALSAGDKELWDRVVSMGPALDLGSAAPLESIAAYASRIGTDALLALGKKTDPASKVIFTGYLKHDLLRHLMPCADLAVFPSEVAEAYPLVLLESISAGVLPAASYFEGLADGLDAIGDHLSGEIGALMRFPINPDERIPAMIRNVTVLLGKEPVWREACRKLAVEVYSWEAIAEKLEKVYEEAVGGDAFTST